MARRTTPQWTPAQIADIVADYQAGTGLIDVGKKYGVGMSAIRLLLIREGVSIRSRTWWQERGARHPKSKITWTSQEVADIVGKYQSGRTITQLCEEYGVSNRPMRAVLHGAGVDIRRPHIRKFSESETADIVRRLNAGEKLSAVATRHGTSYATIRNHYLRHVRGIGRGKPLRPQSDFGRDEIKELVKKFHGGMHVMRLSLLHGTSRGVMRRLLLGAGISTDTLGRHVKTLPEMPDVHERNRQIRAEIARGDGVFDISRRHCVNVAAILDLGGEGAPNPPPPAPPVPHRKVLVEMKAVEKIVSRKRKEKKKKKDFFVRFTLVERTLQLYLAKRGHRAWLRRVDGQKVIMVARKNEDGGHDRIMVQVFSTGAPRAEKAGYRKIDIDIRGQEFPNLKKIKKFLVHAIES